jgi:predicted HTH domain antitoxin
MENVIKIECPEELLIGLHLDAEQFAGLMKREVAISLFKEGKISSGMASKWLLIPRVQFLLKAIEAGAVLLDNNEDDLRRETSLL